MRKIIIFALTFLILFFANKPEISADISVVSSSAYPKYSKADIYSKDPRVIRLKSYLESHKSPLADYSYVFVANADKYDLDWRLVPSITGVESTFGKRIPKGSFNAYGWANGDYHFSSWEDSIEHVSKSLREKYYNQGIKNINQMSRRYAPPSSTWSWKVKFFMNEIDSIPVEFDL